MAIDYRLLDELKRKSKIESLSAEAGSANGNGGSGEPPGTDVGRRLSAVEASIMSIDKMLAVMSEQLKHLASREELRVELATISAKLDGKASTTDVAALAGKLDTKASATDLAELKGRVARIPTVPVLTSILVFVSLLFAAASWAFRHLPPAWTAALQ